MSVPTPVFLHIPATGGVSLTDALQQTIPGTFIIRGQQHIDQFNKLSREDIGALPAIAGQIPHGVHDHIGRKCAYITMMREPIDRIVSGFTSHMLARGLDPAGVSITDHLADTHHPMFDNMFTRRLCNYTWPVEGVHWAWRKPFGQVTSEMYEQAERTLEQCAFVGLFEHYDSSFEGIFARLGYSPPAIPRLNITPADNTLVSVDAVARERLTDLNRFDMKLYKKACSIFLEYSRLRYQLRPVE